MPIVNSGRDFMVSKLISPASVTDRMNVIGVGDGSAPVTAGDTDLKGTNKTYKTCDTNYPLLTNNKVTYQRTFGPAEANHDWKEWGIFNKDSAGKIMLNRVMENMSRKLDGQTWIFKIDITFNRK